MEIVRARRGFSYMPSEGQVLEIQQREKNCDQLPNPTATGKAELLA